MREKNQFLSLFKGKVVIVGVGNTLKGDDGLGPTLAQRLKYHYGAQCFNVENIPENYLGKIAALHPDTLLIIDAVHLDGKPGDFQILQNSELFATGVSTHDVSIKVMLEYLKKEIKGNSYILAVQPENVTLGAPLSKHVKKTLDHLEEMILEAMT